LSVTLLLLFIRPCIAQPLINLSGARWTIDSALTQISAKTGHTFLYRSDLFSRIPPTELHLVNAGWEEAMHGCLAGLDVVFVAHGDSTTLIHARGDGFLHYTPLRGRVTGVGGQPLEGAVVSVDGAGVSFDGAAAGVLTNARGEFSLPVGRFVSAVTVSFTGYAPRTEILSNRIMASVVLRLPEPLDAVVVLPYSKTTRRLTTATVFEVRDTSLADAPVNNLLEALQGRTPGASIRQYNGVPGSAFEVLLGGRHSIQQGNDPLYIVNGVPWATNGFLSTIGSSSAQGANGASALNGIPLSAIGSISVMNDAAATALYGSRASNGVVLITLKEGVSGPLTWTADVNGGVSRTAPTSSLLNTSQFLQLRQEAIQNDGKRVNDTTLPERYKWDPNRYTDFKRLTIGNAAAVRNARVDLNGGGANDGFLVSGRWHKESAVFPGDFYDQNVSAYGNYHHRSADKRLRLGVSAVYNREEIHLPQQDLSQYQYLAPNAPAFTDATGKPQWGTPALPFINIPAATHNNYQGKVNTWLGQGELSYELWSHLFAEARFGYNGIFTRERSLLSVAGQIPFSTPPPVNDTTTAENDYNSEIVEGLVRYLGPLGKSGDHQLDALGGVNYQGQRTHYASRREIPTGPGTTVPGVSSVSVMNRYQALFGRLSYVYRNAYVLTASLRRDGSTKFATGYRYEDFWSVGGAWIFRQEGGGGSPRMFSFGKIKASYGTTGNEQISPRIYDTLTAKMLNNNLRWEINHRAEAGLDLGFFGNRLFFTAVAYRSWTDNQLIYTTANGAMRTPAHFADVPANVVNKGWEFQLLAQGMRMGKWLWSSQLSLTIPVNVLKSFPGLDSTPLAGALVVGHSLTTTKGYHLTGVDPQRGYYTFQAAGTGGNALALVPDPSLDVSWYAGWGHVVQHGHWELHFFFEYRRQNGSSPLVALAKRNPSGVEQGIQLSNGPVEWLAHWRSPGDQSGQQRLTTGSDAMARTALQEYRSSDAAVTRGSYLRLKTAALYYRWNGDQLRRLRGVGRITLYVRGEDLFRVSRFPVTDPETQDPTVLPPMRVVAAGFSVEFSNKADPRAANRPVVMP
jgi:TonB-linked SusC/RagA family outer membrane protein